MPGWIDNFNGPVGMMIGGGKGVLRILYGDKHLASDFIPVDVATKAMLTASWKRGLVPYDLLCELYCWRFEGIDVTGSYAGSMQHLKSI